MTVKERVLALAETPASVLDVNGLGPCAAVGRLKDIMPCRGEQREDFWDKARKAAILGCCAKTRDSLRSGRTLHWLFPHVHAVLCYFAGLKNWFEFSEFRYGEDVFPPDLGGILEWSNTFRCVGTFVNYAGYVRTACIALDMPYVKNSHPAMQRAKLSVVKRMMFTSRCCAPRCFLSNEAVLRNCTCLW